MVAQQRTWDGHQTKGPRMGMWQRFKLIFKSKANSALDRAEDPRQTLDYSYEKQLDLLQKVRRGLADVATSRKRLELQIKQLDVQSAKLEQQARAALSHGREDLAREALTRRSGLTTQINDLNEQLATLTDQEEKLEQAAKQLQAKVEAFRTRKETIKATYSAAEAQTKINEAVSGISNELGDVGLAIQRAEDKTAQMTARAGAIDELLASGALEDATGTSKDPITAELERLSSASDVESTLDALKAELEAPASTPSVPAATPPPAVTAAAATPDPEALPVIEVETSTNPKDGSAQ